MNKIFGKSKQHDPSPGRLSPNPDSGHQIPATSNQSRPFTNEQAREASSQSSLTPSTSQRLQSSQSASRPPIDVAASIKATTAYLIHPVERDRAIEAQENFALPPLASPPTSQEREQKRGFRSRLGISHGHTFKQSFDQGLGLGSTGRVSGVVRTLSVKRKEPVNSQKYTVQAQTEQRPGYSRASSSHRQLVTQVEEEGEFQHNAHGTKHLRQRHSPPPLVPPKEQDYESTYPSQPQTPQAYYSDPRAQLQRANTNLNYKNQGGVELLTPPGPQNHQAQFEEQQKVAQASEGIFAPAVLQHHTAHEQVVYPHEPHQQGQDVIRSQESGLQPRAELSYPSAGRVSLDRRRTEPELQHSHAARTQHHTDSLEPLLLQPAGGAPFEGASSPLAPISARSEGLPSSDQLQGSPSLQPPSTADSPQSSIADMPSAPQSQGRAVRATDNRNALPGSREESSLQQQGMSPSTPGSQSYGSGLAPLGSKGQPYRAQGEARQNEEIGRATPPPQISARSDEEAVAYSQLQKDYKELRDKYQKVKKYYFEREAQVHQLQNTLAQQRMSQSQTSLDDGEYAARFSRLDGLISQLAYSIRKSWKTIPEFLQRVVNRDALATGKQEMTAIGRAYLSYWLYQNVFETFFHPDLEPGLSKDLKKILVNLRKNCPPFQSGEEEEALTAKLIHWRLTTMEGLQERLHAAEAQQHRHRLLERLNDKLVGDVSKFLTDPTPPDLHVGVQMVVDLAVQIAVHVPQESRDVVVDYFLPGYPILPEVMKVEIGIPALTNTMMPPEVSPSDSADRVSLQSNETKDSFDLGDRDPKKSRGMFGGLMGGNSGKVMKSGSPHSVSLSRAKSNQGVSQALTSDRETAPHNDERIRLAAFFAVSIRGRSVLVKAPVYSNAS